MLKYTTKCEPSGTIHLSDEDAERLGVGDLSPAMRGLAAMRIAPQQSRTLH